VIGVQDVGVGFVAAIAGQRVGPAAPAGSELLHLVPGDVVPMSPDGRQGIEVHPLEAPTSMVWSSPGETSWTWQLDPLPHGSTRLITRIRSRMRPTPRSIAFYAVVEIADIWMIRRMLLNLRERAERLPDVAGSTS
jgi:hypothetical protein